MHAHSERGGAGGRGTAYGMRLICTTTLGPQNAVACATGSVRAFEGAPHSVSSKRLLAMHSSRATPPASAAEAPAPPACRPRPGPALCACSEQALGRSLCGHCPARRGRGWGAPRKPLGGRHIGGGRALGEVAAVTRALTCPGASRERASARCGVAASILAARHSGTMP